MAFSREWLLQYAKILFDQKSVLQYSYHLKLLVLQDDYQYTWSQGWRRLICLFVPQCQDIKTVTSTNSPAHAQNAIGHVNTKVRHDVIHRGVTKKSTLSPRCSFICAT